MRIVKGASGPRCLCIFSGTGFDVAAAVALEALGVNRAQSGGNVAR